MTNIRTADEAVAAIMSHMPRATREDMRSVSVDLEIEDPSPCPDEANGIECMCGMPESGTS